MAWNDAASLPRTLVRPEHRCSADNSLRRLVADLDLGLDLWRRVIAFLEDDVPLRIEDANGVALEPRAQIAIRAVVNLNAIDGILGAEVDLPPGIGLSFTRVGLAAVAECAALVAINRSARVGHHTRCSIASLSS